MFHFSRRSLWIVIYISIALIFVLHQTGDDGAPTQEPAPARSQWSLDGIEFTQRDSLWSVDLAGADHISLTVAQPMVPTGAVGADLADAMRTSRQGGQFLVTATNPADFDALTASVDFLVDWLPDGAPRQVIVSGPLSTEILEQAERLLGSLHGAGTPNHVSPQPALGRLSSPPMGSERQLAFLLWVGVLQQRLSGYQPEIRWDHRGGVSEVLFNQTLGPELFVPVTEDELAPVLSAYQASAQQRQRSAQQIHRYLVTSAVYRLPDDFLLDQPRRLDRVTLADVNQQRERSVSEL